MRKYTHDPVLFRSRVTTWPPLVNVTGGRIRGFCVRDQSGTLASTLPQTMSQEDNVASVQMDIQGSYSCHQHRGILDFRAGLRGNCACRKSFHPKTGMGGLNKSRSGENVGKALITG
jgi:hypothetical protein